jgi:parallel beta-helix repeat protein
MKKIFILFALSIVFQFAAAQTVKQFPGSLKYKKLIKFSHVPKYDHIVDPDLGNDANAGTLMAPWRTIEYAHSQAVPGDTIYFKGGVYPLETPAAQYAIWLRFKNGTAGNYINFWNYPGETPEINLAQLSYSGGTIYGFHFTGNYWHWKGFEIYGFPNIPHTAVHNSCYFLNCNNTIIERFYVHDNFSMGIYLAGTTGNTCTNNIILNCDGFYNQDPGTTTDPYGNADGIHMSVTDESSINYILGCRVKGNSDDGLDLFGYSTTGKMIVKNLWAWNNGFLPKTTTAIGDGQGIKLGPPGPAITYNSVKRVVTNCIAAENGASGFSQNFVTHTFGINAFNNTSYKNGVGNNGLGFYLTKGAQPDSIQNNLSYANQYVGNGNPSSIHNHNSWDASPTVTVTDADFVSLDISQLDLPRKADGSLPDITYLKLVTGSDLKNAGVNVGLPYLGTAPDIGALETE